MDQFILKYSLFSLFGPTKKEKKKFYIHIRMYVYIYMCIYIYIGSNFTNTVGNDDQGVLY